VFLTSTNHTNAAIAGKSLKGATLIQFIFTKKLIHFDLRKTPAHQGIANEFLLFHGQGKCYHLSSECQLSGTPETK
jgi:hypothetical protein